jgi:predicted GNAT family N-acyltransferase
MIVRVKQISSKKELQTAFAIRLQVFVREQRVPKEMEIDGDDGRALHLLAFHAGNPAGTARVVMRRGNAKIGRMAVLKNYRARGIGKKLVKRAIAAAKSQRAKKIYLHAQVPVIGFYEGMGFKCVGPIFDEAGIPHRKMILVRV